MMSIGALFGCGAMLAPAVEADVIDDDERRTGERKEGSYFASWNLATRASALLARLTLYRGSAPAPVSARDVSQREQA
jgi:Na+/melibiose symporter-like transporter